jgi:hypothetical protein
VNIPLRLLGNILLRQMLQKIQAKFHSLNKLGESAEIKQDFASHGKYPG